MTTSPVKVCSRAEQLIGLLTALILGAAGTEFVRWCAGAPAAAVEPTPAPAVIERRSDRGAVVHIPARLDGRDEVCTLRIDYNTRTWSLSC